MRFLRLRVRDRLAFVRAAVLVTVVRAALAVLPFRTVLRAADGWARRPGRVPGSEGDRERMLRAVESAARRLLPVGPCLSQAIVADVLLRRSGFDSQLRIGVARGDRGALKAHAWVESDGEVVIGGEESPADYKAFPNLRAAP
jgi:hypothetical protein